ncbi:universal stress protein [Candidatus Accumulibacter phosphatis]|uniref:Universal stress protein n=1 Tax=Candidatus Accumulibacter phosphatis TaxID=327160 RepID=A0ABX1TQL5_9PROT|nr:universal stress protein [Candidatus Accumulibacter phosphatis]NMQ26531.1 universal stress protein [Candidatus Accumulibacter phosphatis]
MTDKKHDSHPQDSAQGPILVPVDFSPHSEAALLLASDFAAGLGARLVVLHVVHDPQNMPGYYARMASKKTLTRIADIAAEMLDEFMAKVQKRHPERKALHSAEILLVTGIPVTRILQVVEKEKARMIVMGSKGATGLRHLLLGSVAEQVLGLAKLPVTIVKEQAKH